MLSMRAVRQRVFKNNGTKAFINLSFSVNFHVKNTNLSAIHKSNTFTGANLTNMRQ